MKIVNTRRWGLLFKRLEKTSTLPALLVVFACTSPTEPGPSVTLLVTNATCEPGPCPSFQVRGFWTHQPVYTPGGRWSMDLGTVSTGSACLILPGADTFRVNTTPYFWTSRDSLSVGILEPGQLLGPASPSTSAFVPANSAGWSITLPGGTAVTPADVCG
jgi:hypothetical protein